MQQGAPNVEAIVKGLASGTALCQLLAGTSAADVRPLLPPEAQAQLDAVVLTIPTTTQPTSLAAFGYTYNDSGKLVRAADGAAFHFVSQQHYDALGDAMALHVQHLMTQPPYNLVRHWLPTGAEGTGVPIFASPDALVNPERLMLLIQGSGAVRAGQWARSLCLNHGLDSGSVLPYIARAQAAGYGVIVFNPNHNHHVTPADPPQTGDAARAFYLAARAPRVAVKRVPIEGHENAPRHTLSVWDAFVAPAAAAHVAIVAHSAGGPCTMAVLRKRTQAAVERIRAIAFTDSVHSMYGVSDAQVQQLLRERAINYLRSTTPLDTPLQSATFGCPCVSAGHERHEWTSATAIESVFRFFASRVHDPDGA